MARCVTSSSCDLKKNYSEAAHPQLQEWTKKRTRTALKCVFRRWRNEYMAKERTNLENLSRYANNNFYNELRNVIWHLTQHQRSRLWFCSWELTPFLVYCSVMWIQIVCQQNQWETLHFAVMTVTIAISSCLLVLFFK